jgi:FdhE protein
VTELIQRMISAFERMREDLPQLKVIFDAFEPLFIAHFSFKESIPELGPSVIDQFRHSEGAPFLFKQDFTTSDELFKKAGDALIPALEQGFPSISEQLQSVHRAVNESRLKLEDCLTAISAGTEEQFNSICRNLDLEPENAGLILTRLVKPFAERRAESLKAIVEEHPWHRGYCPMCGSWPELSFLQNPDGHRNLRCSFCGHVWGYPRLQCPFCETTNQDKLELFYTKARDFERAEVCHECKKYIVGIDCRASVYDVVLEVVPLGLVHFDVVAQDKGFSPGAVCSWNVI